MLRTDDVGRWTPDDGRRTLNTGELKTLSKLDLEPKCQGHSRNKAMTWGSKTCHPKNLSRGSLSNWCDSDKDALLEGST